ncbi:hypothetical protein RhiirA4_459343 [Rhizophagus irregularis]|uniref:Uncharacterized protein n=1 Tax=Rhizophagus irregularis TaxID=588596 RepID=A0A2I1GE27_9GLOM|nr:hypothetical protein RhiirA4_459343 [Rhizophagus irregularis]
MPSQTNIDSNQTIFSDLTNLELDGSSSEKHQNHDTIQDDQYKNNIDEYNNIIDILLYDLDKIQKLISKQFQSAEELNEPVWLLLEGVANTF